MSVGMENLRIVSSTAWEIHLSHPIIAVISWILVWLLGRACYNVFFHPLRDFPGPLTARASRVWKTHKLVAGTLPQSIKQLHEKYGPVVRFAPTQLSFIDSQAWRDIYGHHGDYEMSKDNNFYRPMGDRVPDSIITADRASHSVLRRQLSHGFSDRCMREQNPIITNYVDLLIRRLREHSRNGEKPVDMTAWFNYTTFDIIGNLGFGSDFGCLERSYYHPSVDAIANNLRDNFLLQLLIQGLPGFILYLASQLGMFKGRDQHISYSKKKIDDRMALDHERPDFIEGLLKKKDQITRDEVEMTASVLLVAGSETTATLMSGALFLIGSNRPVLEELTREVRTTFNDEAEITLNSVQNLKYMLACLNESLRMYPPVPVGLPRIVPKGGHEIAGYWVPQDTSVAVWQLAANYSKRNFADAENFHPDRYMGSEKFATDDLSASQPFSIGPRNCVGQNMAYAEMRLIIARILFNFDIELAPGAEDWIKRQQIFTLWQKPQLPVLLKAVAH